MHYTKNRTWAFAATLAIVAAAIPALAHHGTAAFDIEKIVTVKGTVNEFAYVNPHCQLFFQVKDAKGELIQWQGELTAPNKLNRAGWTKRTLKPGDPVTVSGFQVKSGEHTLWIRKLIGPDGEELPLSED